MKRLSEETFRMVKIGKSLYRITRAIDYSHDFTEIFVDRWTGVTWQGVHYWTSR